MSYINQANIIWPGCDIFGSRPVINYFCVVTRCWSAKPNERPSMNEVVEAMIDLMMFFPGGDDPLNFPSHDTDSGSEDGYACESVSERY